MITLSLLSSSSMTIGGIDRFTCFQWGLYGAAPFSLCSWPGGRPISGRMLRFCLMSCLGLGLEPDTFLSPRLQSSLDTLSCSFSYMSFGVEFNHCVAANELRRLFFGLVGDTEPSGLKCCFGRSEFLGNTLGGGLCIVELESTLYRRCLATPGLPRPTVEARRNCSLACLSYNGMRWLSVCQNSYIRSNFWCMKIIHTVGECASSMRHQLALPTCFYIQANPVRWQVMECNNSPDPAVLVVEMASYHVNRSLLIIKFQTIVFMIQAAIDSKFVILRWHSESSGTFSLNPDSSSEPGITMKEYSRSCKYSFYSFPMLTFSLC